jgi:DNA-binding GntR family transcriptional regulator
MLRSSPQELRQAIANGSFQQGINCSNFSITEMIESAGSKLGSSYLSFQKETAGEQKAQQLSVQLGKPIITVERVRIEQWRITHG